ncbi:elongator complex protein 1 isoform X2 [Tachypleus tridentatus]|uniref:elongator complex protein 1 isoform X2 n=1 Tax=Tachypleus tridentatus TaxID=6853 RepID=UPI003FD466C9
MKNLKLIHLKQVECKTLKYDEASKVCVNSESHVVYVISEEKLYAVSAEVDEFQFLTSLEPGVIVAFTYLYEKQSLCIAMENGNLFLVDIFTKTVECVGFVQGGLLATSWSPDQEIILFLTAKGTLVLMTKDFDPVLEKSLHSVELGEVQHVRVGWGSKGTQFHGSEGKEAAKLQEKTIQHKLTWDDGQTRICWRGDGQFFCTSFIDPERGCRILKIWNREAALQYVAEEVDGLEHPLDWRSSGNLITSSQTKLTKHDIVFFEKNGLRHGEFTLPFLPGSFKIKEVIWNSESTILAIWGQLIQEINGYREHRILLWTTSNYHWYLKQSLNFNNYHVTAVLWDVIDPWMLHVTCAGGQYLCYKWTWIVNHSQSCSSDDNACVAVIDGAHLKMTPFHQTVIPPPMCAYELEFPDTISQVVFHPKVASTYDMLVILSDGRVALCNKKYSSATQEDCCVIVKNAGGNYFKKQDLVHCVTSLFRVHWSDMINIPLIPLCIHHWTCVADNTVLCASPLQSRTALLSVHIGSEKALGRLISMLKAPLVNICTNSDGGIVALQLTDGLVLKYSLDTEAISPWATEQGDLQFPQPCSTMVVCKVAGKDRVLGLTERFHFYCDNVQLSSNCTSFCCNRDFLFITTHDHTLRSLSLGYELPQIMEGSLVHDSRENIRYIERGSRIVVTVSCDTKVILQMPRGNIESIHPRSLVLAKILSLLDNLCFGQALEMMRKHRINTNLLYDHNPQVFLENTRMFVEQINDISRINLFLMDLKEDNVAKTMYSSAYYHKEQVNYIPSSGNKVDIVCDAVRLALSKAESDWYCTREKSEDNLKDGKQKKLKYLLGILTAHVKKKQPELEDALIKIKKLKDSTSNCDITPLVSADEALKYLLYMVNVNELFDVALGTYSFDMVLMVAEKTQKDPKEYLPFLNELQQLDPTYQKYKIDLHLHRFKKSLHHICKCEGHFDECLNLIKDQRLYKDALHIFSEGSSEWKGIWTAYGDYLVKKKYYEEAGLVYFRSEQYQKAVTAFQDSQNWELALCAATKAEISENQVVQLALSLAEKLKTNKHFFEAAVLLDQYVMDSEGAIATLIEGHKWKEAMRMIHKYKRLDLMETHLRPNILTESSVVQEMIQEVTEKIITYTQRLKCVRKTKRLKKTEVLCDETFSNDTDLYSDISSVSGLSSKLPSFACKRASSLSGSLMTRCTSRKKKENRKKYTLKEGSQNEDLALIAALSDLFHSSDRMKDEVGSLLKTLVMMGYDQEAVTLQHSFADLLELIEISTSDVWPTYEHDTEVIFGPQSTANTLAMALQEKNQDMPHIISDPDLRNPPPTIKSETWKLTLLQ